MSAFADDNYTIKWNSDIDILKADLENSLSRVVTWLTKSGLKVNEAKTEICLFSRTNMPPVFIKISNQEVESKNQINVLGIIFDSNLQWGPQVTSTLKKANKALNAIRLINNYFTSNELLQQSVSTFI